MFDPDCNNPLIFLAGKQHNSKNILGVNENNKERFAKNSMKEAHIDKICRNREKNQGWLPALKNLNARSTMVLKKL